MEENTMGKRIHDLRVRANLTQTELGERLGVKKGAISTWENGVIKNIKKETIEQMAALFDVSPGYILGYEEPARYGEPASYQQVRLLNEEIRNASPASTSAYDQAILAGPTFSKKQLDRLISYFSILLDMKEDR